MRAVWTITLLLAAFVVQAQDAFFSQPRNNPLHLNPAHTGMMDRTDNRMAAFYRDQWRSIASPYRTSMLSYERKVYDSEDERVGIGAHIFYDRAGDGNLSTLKADLSAAYGMHLNEDNQLLSFGIRLGYSRRSVELDELLFSSQNGDPTAASGETFNEDFNVFDFGVGLALENRIKDDHGLTFGIAVDNLSNPVNSFAGEPRTRFIRVSPYVHTEIAVAEYWAVLPGIYFNNQNGNRQYLLQFLARWALDPDAEGIYAEFGAFYRVGDAVVPAATIALGGIKIAASYDINLSGLNDATGGRGAFEVCVIAEF